MPVTTAPPTVRAVTAALAVLLGLLTACRPTAALEVAGVTSDAGRTVVGAEDGRLPEGSSVSPFDDVPALTRLDGPLLAAVRGAARAAAADGVDLRVTSGWRSAAYQQELFDEAVRRYGSPAEARKLVLSPERSAHVTGRAVDVGPTDATSWMAQHGADHGLCQTYANESWHFELATDPGGECPPVLADATAG